MGQTTAQRKIKALEKQVTELTESVNSKESWNKYVERRYQSEVEETHKVLDLMGVPQSKLPLPSRLTLLMTMIGMRGVIQLQKQQENSDD